MRRCAAVIGWDVGQGCRPAHSSRLLADNPLRLTHVATGRVVPLAGLLGLLRLDVESEVEPFQTTARTTHLDIGRVAIGSGYDVISDEGADLGAEDTEHPQQACERHYEDGCDLSKAERVIR